MVLRTMSTSGRAAHRAAKTRSSSVRDLDKSSAEGHTSNGAGSEGRHHLRRQLASGSRDQSHERIMRQRQMTFHQHRDPCRHRRPPHRRVRQESPSPARSTVPASRTPIRRVRSDTEHERASVALDHRPAGTITRSARRVASSSTSAYIAGRSRPSRVQTRTRARPARVKRTGGFDQTWLHRHPTVHAMTPAMNGTWSGTVKRHFGVANDALAGRSE
jgi:hypothetical protein